MTSRQIRQSFLDFFKSKQHTIVPSSSLLPDSPNLLFTNAGMNQFVPIFLGQRAADVDKWSGAIPARSTRAADTQKCIRAGGKHNDLEDVGLDTYHHTFFEMLGNWSFGDYFKKEAIDWAWELVTEVWRFPRHRLYATIYSPDKSKGDPSEFDQEAYDLWAAKFSAAGLDPKVHIVNGNKKDNFWMMGETGPCGPCSEIHVDLTPQGDTKGALVNQGTAECIEIWNLVFIQFNANPDGTFSPLPARHVDTGMGFERVTGIIQNTKGFTDFSRVISNYETDVFRPIFDRLEKLSGKRYGSTLPKPGSTGSTEQEKIDVAFRVIADHIRTLSFAIADGILPGNNDRNYVLRRILRRAVRYGRTLGFHQPFFFELATVLADDMGEIFPEIRARQKHVQEVIRTEEVAFNKTLDRGIELFREETECMRAGAQLTGDFAFKLSDTYGFPPDLTQLMARERGLTVDVLRFNQLLEEQKARARAAQHREVISLANIELASPSRFVGYDELEANAKVLDVLHHEGKTALLLDVSPCYAEMGGQVGDTGELTSGSTVWYISSTQKAGNSFVHLIAGEDAPAAGTPVQVRVDSDRRQAIQRHHTVTHLLHWAIHEVVSREASQKGSFVGPEKLTFDFNCAPLTRQQVLDVEKLVNERIVENGGVSWTEIPYTEVKGRKDVMQFFGDKYGDRVRLVQIGGRAGELNGYSMELCGGTHTRATGEIGLFRIVSEAAVSSGVRRIEAVAGGIAYAQMRKQSQLIETIAARLNSPLGEIEKKIDSLLAHQKELEKEAKAQQQRQAAEMARSLVAKAGKLGSTLAIVENLGGVEGDFLQMILEALPADFKGAAVLGSAVNGTAALAARVAADLAKKIQAGKVIQTIAPIVGGKGGGRPDFARGGGKDPSKLEEALAKAREFITAAG